MKTIEQLANNVIGQIQGINKMIATDKDCKDVLVQFKAAKQALNSMMSKYIEDSFGNCLSAPSKKNNKATLESIFQEVIKM